jgi:hypothetical protein
MACSEASRSCKAAFGCESSYPKRAVGFQQRVNAEPEGLTARGFAPLMTANFFHDKFSPENHLSRTFTVAFTQEKTLTSCGRINAATITAWR